MCETDAEDPTASDPRLVQLVALLRLHERDATSARFLELAAMPGDPLARDHFDPGHFTASGFVVSPGRDALLLVHHRRLDRWLQPGGHVDASDPSVESAARREVIEETGVELDVSPAGVIDLDVHPIPAGRGEPPHHHFDVRYLFVAVDTMLEIDRDEVNDAAWVALEDVVAGMGDRSVRRVAEKVLTGGG